MEPHTHTHSLDRLSVRHLKLLAKGAAIIRPSSTHGQRGARARDPAPHGPRRSGAPAHREATHTSQSDDPKRVRGRLPALCWRVGGRTGRPRRRCHRRDDGRGEDGGGGLLSAVGRTYRQPKTPQCSPPFPTQTNQVTPRQGEQTEAMLHRCLLAAAGLVGVGAFSKTLLGHQLVPSSCLLLSPRRARHRLRSVIFPQQLHDRSDLRPMPRHHPLMHRPDPTPHRGGEKRCVFQSGSKVRSLVGNQPLTRLSAWAQP